MFSIIVFYLPKIFNVFGFSSLTFCVNKCAKTTLITLLKSVLETGNINWLLVRFVCTAGRDLEKGNIHKRGRQEDGGGEENPWRGNKQQAGKRGPGFIIPQYVFHPQPVSRRVPRHNYIPSPGRLPVLASPLVHWLRQRQMREFFQRIILIRYCQFRVIDRRS